MLEISLIIWCFLGAIIFISFARSLDNKKDRTTKQDLKIMFILFLCGPLMWIFYLCCGIFVISYFLVKKLKNWIEK